MEFEFDAPTWNEIYEMLLSLAERIGKSGFKPDIILAVSRGGWIPTRVLCDLLGNPNLADVRVEFYSGVAETRGEPNLTQPVSVPLADQKVLIMDEIADTGKSLRLLKEHVTDQGAKEVKVAVIYCKPHSIVKPDFFEKEASSWIIFPWEIRETIRRIIQESGKKGESREVGIAKLVRAGVPSELVERFVKEVLEEEEC